MFLSLRLRMLLLLQPAVLEALGIVWIVSVQCGLFAGSEVRREANW